MNTHTPAEGESSQTERPFHWRGEELSDDWLLSMLDSANVGLWEVDMVTHDARRSRAHADIFGQLPEEVTSWSFDSFENHIFPADRARVESVIQEGVLKGTGWRFECRILRKDKSMRWVMVTSSPVPGNLSASRYFRGIVVDITERRLAEQAERERAYRFSVVANSAPVLIWMSGVDQLCDFFNESWLAFTGRTMEQELGNGWTVGVHPDDHARCVETYGRHFKARVPFQMEFRLRRHDGVYRWILDHGVPRFHPDGNFAGFVGSCVDITEQRLDWETAEAAARTAKVMQGELEALTAQLKVILDTSPLGIGLLRDRQVVWTNSSYQALLGYSEDESRGMSTETLCADASDSRRLEVEAEGVLLRGETYTTELRLRKKDGGVRWCQILCKSIGSGNAQNGSIWLLKDIEDLRRTRALCRLQNAMLAHMAEGVVLVSASTGVILHTNPMFDKLLGYAPGELHGRPISVVNAPGELSRDETAANIIAELHRNGRWEGEITNQRKDGTPIVCHASVSHFEHSEYGHVWLAVHNDITQAKAAVRALRESKERYDELVKQVPCGVQTVRLHPDGTYVFDFISPRTSQLIGVERAVLYKDATQWIQNAWPEDAVLALSETQRCILTKTPFKWEGRFNVAGSTRWLRFEGCPVAQPGGDVLWNSVVNDITEQKRLEVARREAEKLASVGQLAGGMAHGLNNILAAMMMSVGLAQDDSSPATVQETLRTLEQGCIRAGDLIKQLLAISGKSLLCIQQIELNDFVSSQVPLLETLMGERYWVQLTTYPHPLWISGDAALLRQALRDLCENAKDSMKDGGPVRISIESIDVGSDQVSAHPEITPGRFARLSVQDEGCGINTETRMRLFEPFFTTKEVGKGTGLGLATVLGIVRQHKGWVEVESEMDKGSRFHIHLPLEQAAESPAVPRHGESSSPSAKATILLVEDDASLRQVVSRLLNRFGYRVFEARDAIAAHAVWRTHGEEIDLLLTDVVMPGDESGPQLAQRLLQQRPGLRVILTSGFNTSMEEQPEEFRLRVVYLAKPVPCDVLLRTIGQCLGHPQ